MIKSSTSVVRAATIVAGFAIIAAGCSKSPSEALTEKLIESQTDGDVDVDLDGGDFSIKTEDGSFSVDEDGNFQVTDADGQVVTGQSDGDGNVTIEGEDGGFTLTQDSELPEEWPSDVPKPDGLAITSSSVLDTGSGNAVTLVGTADDGFAESYGSALASAGLERGFESNNGDTYSAIYGNDSWQISFGTSTIDGEIQVTVSLFPNDS